MTRRRWIADTHTATHASLTGMQAQHLARVLRAGPGQVFDVVAGGHLHRAEIVSVTDSEVIFLLHEEMLADPALPLHLLLAVFKFDRYEWAIEKATELGVERITPVLARRTEKHLALSSTNRVARWRRIAHEAAQQSRRSDVPTIDDPIALKSALETTTASQKILLAETEEDTSLAGVLSPHQGAATALAIGPEGGWTPEEMALFTEQNWRSVTLGPRILRAETAAIAALAIASALL
jgi:16S rRNA (uracil1498-N3)-methyltransferase